MSAAQFEYILYTVIFVGVLLFIEGAYFLLAGSRSGAKAINRRMQMLAAGGASREVLDTLRRRQDGLKGPFAVVPGLTALDALIAQSGVGVTVGRIVAIMAMGAVALTLTLLLFFPVIPPILTPAFAIPAAIFLPVGFLHYRRKKRIKDLSAQLPDALDLMVRSLRAGHPITTSLTLVAREMKDPMGTEIGIVVDEMTYGLDFREALQNLGERVPAPDLHYLLVTINIQHGTGGNLAEVLDNLSKVIRARYQMFAKIRALSAEGRISAIILSAIPFFVMAAVWLTTPGYYTKVIDDPALPVIAGIAMTMELTAIAVMWKMVNFKV